VVRVQPRARRPPPPNFHIEQTRDGRYIGRVIEFPKLRTRPHTNRLDAVDEIITTVRDRIREIHQSMNNAPVPGVADRPHLEQGRRVEL
jgi:hypothetical protein